MSMLETGNRVIMRSENFGELLQELKQQNYATVGPTIQENAIVYEELNEVDDLPIGYTEKQEKAHYRLKERSDDAFFGFTVGPQSWKKFLNPSEVKLWSAERSEEGFEIETDHGQVPDYAFIGVRPCDLKAIHIMDRVFLEGPYKDKIYAERRDDTFIVTVNCTEAGNTCFCASMGAGPRSEEGFDLALTEVIDEDRHFFVTEIGSDRGAEIMNEVTWEEAESEQIRIADRRVDETAESMGRNMNTERLRDLLFDNYNHPQWEDVANRCLSCANCTMVCPTCFCHTVEEVTDLEGNHAERWRTWDSCFNLAFSYIHGGSVRKSIRSRYRQWMTHKLASWRDQFGTSGCVGCGRCITWCPAGIDITEEVQAIRKDSEVPEETVDQPR